MCQSNINRHQRNGFYGLYLFQLERMGGIQPNFIEALWVNKSPVLKTLRVYRC